MAHACTTRSTASIAHAATKSAVRSATTCATRSTGCRRAAKLVTVKRDCDLTAHMVSIEETLLGRPRITRRAARRVHALRLQDRGCANVGSAPAAVRRIGPEGRLMPPALPARPVIRGEYETVQTVGAARRLARRDRRRRADLVRHRNHVARSDDGADRRHVAVGGSRPWPPIFRSRIATPDAPRATAARDGAANAEAVARKRRTSRRSART